MKEQIDALKAAYKVLKFWFPVLLETDYMNDAPLRRDYLAAMAITRSTRKQLKKGR